MDAGIDEGGKCPVVGDLHDIPHYLLFLFSFLVLFLFLFPRTRSCTQQIPILGTPGDHMEIGGPLQTPRGGGCSVGLALPDLVVSGPLGHRGPLTKQPQVLAHS